MGTDFRVGAWLVRPSLNTVSRNGTSVRLEPKVMQVLVCLARQPGEAVAKEQLLKTVWPDTFVTDDVLIRSISELRRVFEDDAREPRTIQTIPKSGYRLVAPVEWVNGATKPAKQLIPEAENKAVVNNGKSWMRALALVAAAVLFVFLVANVGRLQGWLAGKSGAPQIHSLAVLPLQNLSGDPAQEYFSDGLTDTLITNLAQIGSLKVISRTSSMQYKQTKKSLPEIVRELQVDGIVEGTVQHSGNRVQINVQLIHGASDKHLWAQSYDREISDLFALEQDVAQNIARQVRGKTADANQTFARVQKPVNEAALDAYLQGNFLLTRGEWGVNDDQKRRASTYFQKAIDADPDFEAAYIGLAQSHNDLLRGSAEDGLIRKKSAQRVLELNPNSAEAHVILADLKQCNFEWTEAEEEYRKATELEPNNADAHNSLGTILAATGRLDDGLRESQIAQALDPNGEHLSAVLEMRGEFDRAAAMLLAVARNSPEDGMINYELYRTYAGSGKQKEAVDQLEKALSKFGMQDIAITVQGSYAKSGYRAAMQALAKGLEDLNSKNLVFLPENMAAAYAAAGDTDRAFYWLNQAYEHREMVSHDWGLNMLREDPLLTPLRSDPRFKDLLRRIGLPP